MYHWGKFSDMRGNIQINVTVSLYSVYVHYYAVQVAPCQVKYLYVPGTSKIFQARQE